MSWFLEICTPKKKATWKKHRKKNDPLEKCPLGKLPLEKSPLTKRWKMKTSFYYQYMIVVWHMKMVVQWVSQKFPDGECAPAVFLPYMLIIIFNKSLLKHSLRCSSKLFFRSWNEPSEEDLPTRWEEDCLWRRLPDNVFWNKLYKIKNNFLVTSFCNTKNEFIITSFYVRKKPFFLENSPCLFLSYFSQGYFQ